MREILVLIIKNSLKDLSVFNFPEFKILNIYSDEFQEILTKTNIPKSDFLDIVEVDNKIYKPANRYAIIQSDLTKTLSIKKVYDIYNFLKILFPSTLQIEYTLSFHLNPELRYLDTFKSDESLRDYEEDLIDYKEEKIDEINKFINNSFNKIQNIKYINIAKTNYINAYESNHLHFALIAFCITLESVINDSSELLYRISRAVAILCGRDTETSEIIFKNLKKIYALRSKIVHGSEYDENLVSDYLYYLECICSKVITELLIHQIENHKSLNDKFTIYGFGKRSEISDNWYNFDYNPRIENTIYNLL